MHELSMISNLLRKVEDLAVAEQAGKVVGVKIRLGALAHCSPGHFRQHFHDGTKGTRLEGARLEISESQDTADPNAQDIILESIEVDSRA